MSLQTSVPPFRIAALAAALSLALAGCSSMGSFLAGEKVDYRSGATRTKGLDVPPDLTQLARDGRYVPPAAVVSATGSGAAKPTAAAPTVAAVAPTQLDAMRILRDADARWLVVPMTPDQLWPQLKAFWTELGFTIAREDAKAGVIETDWSENRAKLPQDGIRKLIGRVFDGLYDTGERDRFRMRVEPSANGSEVYISHRGMIEVLTGDRKDLARWTSRPSDPQLEGEFISRLMVRLGSTEDVARTALATPQTQPAKARLLSQQGAVGLEIDDSFDRAWRRVGIALDRTGFTVEDRNRADGLYYVRYVNDKDADKDKGFFKRLFGSSDEAGKAVRYRIALKGAGADKSLLAVQNADGAPDSGATGQRIASLLLSELK